MVDAAPEAPTGARPAQKTTDGGEGQARGSRARTDGRGGYSQPEASEADRAEAAERAQKMAEFNAAIHEQFIIDQVMKSSSNDAMKQAWLGTTKAIDEAFRDSHVDVKSEVKKFVDEYKPWGQEGEYVQKLAAMSEPDLKTTLGEQAYEIYQAEFQALSAKPAEGSSPADAEAHKGDLRLAALAKAAEHRAQNISIQERTVWNIVIEEYALKQMPAERIFTERGEFDAYVKEGMLEIFSDPKEHAAIMRIALERANGKTDDEITKMAQAHKENVERRKKQATPEGQDRKHKVERGRQYLLALAEENPNVKAAWLKVWVTAGEIAELRSKRDDLLKIKELISRPDEIKAKTEELNGAEGKKGRIQEAEDVMKQAEAAMNAENAGSQEIDAYEAAKKAYEVVNDELTYYKLAESYIGDPARLEADIKTKNEELSGTEQEKKSNAEKGEKGGKGGKEGEYYELIRGPKGLRKEIIKAMEHQGQRIEQVPELSEFLDYLDLDYLEKTGAEGFLESDEVKEMPKKFAGLWAELKKKKASIMDLLRMFSVIFLGGSMNEIEDMVEAK